jgi:flavin reductase (DIM6/NTAB) family NADH-FMN oxidoreductase RutF
MAVGLAKQHHTCGLVAKAGRFAMHLLWPDQLDLVWRFALASGRDLDKFAGLDVRESPLGNPLIPQALAWLDCRVETRLDTGDRILFLAEVCAGETRGNSIPLTVNRLYYEAPEDKRRELASLYQHDSGVDADAIRAWRKQRGAESS